MLIETLRPLCVRQPTGDLHLKPGFLAQIPDAAAVKLLAKKPDTVRRVSVPTGYCMNCSEATGFALLPTQNGNVGGVLRQRREWRLCSFLAGQSQPSVGNHLVHPEFQCSNRL